jgi:endonuclease-3 related protein
MKLQRHYQKLLAEYGPQGWWPGQTRAEIIVGAILTQNTAWTNVEKALSRLRTNSALNFQTLAETPQKILAEWIRPSGYFNQKAGYLKAFAQMLVEEYGGSLNWLFKLETPELRKTLLAVKGIGPETADSILLYAAKRPVFVVDAYTRRFLAAHGYKKQSEASYDEIAAFFTAQLPENVPLFNEYHALIVRRAKDHPIKRGAGAPACGIRQTGASLPHTFEETRPAVAFHQKLEATRANC